MRVLLIWDQYLWNQYGSSNNLYHTEITFAMFVLGSQRCVVGEGMPKYKDVFVKGNLYIKFEVIFPPDGFISDDSVKVRWVH